MKIAVVGTGYVGLVSGACLSETGWDVTCVDKDAGKVERLKEGIIPIYEPGLDEIVTRNVAEDRLHFTTSLKDAIKDATIIIIAVGTPTRKIDGNADLQYVYAVAEEIANTLDHYAVVVTKSTVPAHTGEEIKRIISGINPTLEYDIASNPEFLREGNAIIDFMEPDRIVVGTETDKARDIMAECYKPFTDKGVNVIHTDVVSSELIKYAANTFLATKVSFINEMADICERLGGDIESVSRGMGTDKRIGTAFLRPGPGYGGSCFPKDTLAMVNIGERALSPATIVESVIAVNRARPHRMVSKIVQACGGNVRGKRIALLGLTFKPDTDDVRDSIPLIIANELVSGGATVIATDPQGIEEAKHMIGDIITYVDNAHDALKDADIGVLATEWSDYKAITPAEYKSLLKSPVLVDLRNVYTPDDMRNAGMHYHSIGRASVAG